MDVVDHPKESHEGDKYGPDGDNQQRQAIHSTPLIHIHAA
jgi:hypothetical protein